MTRITATVACLGGAGCRPGDPAYEVMQTVGLMLAVNQITVAFNGHSGTGLEAAARGAVEAGGVTWGLVLEKQEDRSRYIVEEHVCKDHDERRALLLSCTGFVFGAQADVGTSLLFSETVELNERHRRARITRKQKPIVVLRPQGAVLSHDDGEIDRALWAHPQVLDNYRFTDNPTAAVLWLITELEKKRLLRP